MLMHEVVMSHEFWPERGLQVPQVRGRERAVAREEEEERERRRRVAMV